MVEEYVDGPAPVWNGSDAIAFVFGIADMK